MRQYLIAFATAGLVLAATTSSRADIVMVPASSIQGANVLFNNGTQTGDTVFGFTQGGTQVAFTGTTTNGTELQANGGQALISGALNTSTSNPNDTYLLTSLSFSLVGGNTFNNLEFNVFGGTATSVTFTGLDNAGDPFSFTNLALGNGSNFFGFEGINGQSIQTFSMSFGGGGVAGVGDIQQIRLDETVAGAVPEASTWAMMILGFAGVGFLAYRRRGYKVEFRAV